MSISSRFSVAIHILTLLEVNKEGTNTSEFIAGSVKTNPVVVRKIMGMLKKAELIQVQPGIAGAKLAKEHAKISLFDVYKAVNVVEENELFGIHEYPNPDCPVGRNIEEVIAPIFITAQHALEKVLLHVTLQDIVHSVQEKESNEQKMK
ncbi:Rrf2 family transcriptional regulator [Solibacillus daqui]|uniref:Rrf2 family transcriptional regulator n=1 Tax=Solibacillus daqui TaxID=2912187 RepID=UPI00236607C9|nr:Rrf2 family transcriptional regulator [Solibacillus daqui]